MDRRQELAGLGFAALCVLLAGAVPAVAKLTTSRADALFVATATSLFAGLGAVGWLIVRGSLHELFDRRRVGGLATVGAVSTACTYFLFFEGARRTSAVDAVLCLQTECAYSLVLARAFLGHPLTTRRVGAALLLLAGIALAIGSAELEGEWLGYALLLATPLCWQVSHLIAVRGLAGVRPRVLTGARYVYGGVLLVLVWLLGGGPARLPDPAALTSLLPLLALQGIVLSFVGTMLWYQTIERLDLARSTAIIVPSIPLLSIGASFVLLGEVASGRQWAGLALIGVGVMAFVTAPHPVVARERIPSASAPIVVRPDAPEGPPA
jgi:drug/metabolite transporter (DMT)-like permease